MNNEIFSKLSDILRHVLRRGAFFFFLMGALIAPQSLSGFLGGGRAGDVELHTSNEAREAENVSYKFIASELGVKPVSSERHFLRENGKKLLEYLATIYFTKKVIDNTGMYTGIFQNIPGASEALNILVAVGGVTGVAALISSNYRKMEHEKFLDFLQKWPKIKHRVPAEMYPIIDPLYESFEERGGVLAVSDTESNRVRSIIRHYAVQEYQELEKRKREIERKRQQEQAEKQNGEGGAHEEK